MRIFDFSSCPFSDRNGTYGGNKSQTVAKIEEGNLNSEKL